MVFTMISTLYGRALLPCTWKKVKESEDYYIDIQKIIEMGITLDPISYKTILKSHAVRIKNGLMIND